MAKIKKIALCTVIFMMACIAIGQKKIMADSNYPSGTVLVDTKQAYYDNLISQIKSGNDDMFYAYSEDNGESFLSEKGLVSELGRYCQDNMSTDNYAVYNIGKVSYKQYISSKGNEYFEVKISYYDTKEEEKLLDAKVSSIVDSLGIQESSEYEKIREVHDYIIERISYDNSLEKFSAYDGIINETGVCTSYALAFQKFMDYLKIPCKCVYSQNHQWNSVYLDGKWYNLDLTWDDSKVEKYQHVWFLQDNGYFKEFHGEMVFCTATIPYDIPENDFNYNVTRINDIEYKIEMISKKTGEIMSTGKGEILGEMSVQSEQPSQKPVIEVTQIPTLQPEQKEEPSIEPTSGQIKDLEDSSDNNDFGIGKTLFFFMIGALIGTFILWIIFRNNKF